MVDSWHSIFVQLKVGYLFENTHKKLPHRLTFFEINVNLHVIGQCLCRNVWIFLIIVGAMGFIVRIPNSRIIHHLDDYLFYKGFRKLVVKNGAIIELNNKAHKP